MKSTTGTREWSEVSSNIGRGCANNRDEHFEPVMTLLRADEPDPFSQWPSP
jgi:hypothetical protein